MPATTLPPGQHAVSGFPRFGTHLANPAPAVPADPVIAIGGAAVAEPAVVPLGALATLPRRELTADFHCVAGWSATGLEWEGVAFEDFHRAIIEPKLQAGATVTHVVFGGLDGYRSIVAIEDALAGDVLIADRLGGRPLEADHGAPVRLVSPGQYGYVSTKHLCSIDLHTSEPAENFASASRIAKAAFRTPLFERHPRARVWQEERHPYLPAWSLRPVYRAFIPPIAFLCARGSDANDRRIPNAEHESRPWRIHEIAHDFTLEDAWALPVDGGVDDFQTLLDLMSQFDPASADSLPARFLWDVRDRLGRWFGLGRISTPASAAEAGGLPIPGTGETSLTGRLPGDLRGTASDVDFGSLPFTPLYRTDDEFAAEISNQTVHGVMHLAWVDRGDGGYGGQMAVYVKPRGPLGRGYMELIKPFRHWIVYPALMRQFERAWIARTVPDAAP